MSLFLHRKVLRTLQCNKKPSGQERTAAEWNDVAEAIRRRRRIPRAGFFFVSGFFLIYPDGLHRI
ncbi:hypothetical protein DWZ56_11410 [Lachnotalea sp. AF33-28]|nr:hypothetical protein DWZ56_11410 [Lachnotalea sp. AF33-28]